MNPSAELQALLERYYALMQSITYRPEARDTGRLTYFRGLLDQLDVVDTSLLSIFDLSCMDHVYFSKKYGSMLGWDLDSAHDEGVAYVNARFHPHDMLYLTRSGIYFMEWALQQPPEERRKYKHISAYRMQNGAGAYVPVIEQQSVLELDADGHIWLVLSVIDRAPEVPAFQQATAHVQHIETGARIEPPPREGTGTLSPREREIIQLIAQGLPSKQVADRLFLSVHTVNTHRQRILEKTGAASMTEAVRWAASRGLLG